MRPDVVHQQHHDGAIALARLDVRLYRLRATGRLRRAVGQVRRAIWSKASMARRV
jgi:hypothetical protein